MKLIHRSVGRRAGAGNGSVAKAGGLNVQHGFTLIEMMIVVALVAILAVVALPAYRSTVMKARRADARAALVTTAQLMERFSTERGATGYSTATISDTPGSTVVAKSTTDGGYYRVALSNATVTTFTLSAVPYAGQATDACGTLTLDASGVRGVSGGTGTAATCW